MIDFRDLRDLFVRGVGLVRLYHVPTKSLIWEYPALDGKDYLANGAYNYAYVYHPIPEEQEVVIPFQVGKSYTSQSGYSYSFSY